DEEDRPRSGGREKKQGKKPARPATPTLRKVGIALHELARAEALDRAYELDALVDRLLRRVEAQHPEPLVLVGPAGVGKSAALLELTTRMARADGPEEPRE